MEAISIAAEATHHIQNAKGSFFLIQDWYSSFEEACKQIMISAGFAGMENQERWSTRPLILMTLEGINSGLQALLLSEGRRAIDPSLSNLYFTFHELNKDTRIFLVTESDKQAVNVEEVCSQYQNLFANRLHMDSQHELYNPAMLPPIIRALHAIIVVHESLYKETPIPAETRGPQSRFSAMKEAPFSKVE